MKEKVLVIHWEWSQRGKGDHSRFLATELGMKLGILDLRSIRRYVGLLSAYLLPWEEGP